MMIFLSIFFIVSLFTIRNISATEESTRKVSEFKVNDEWLALPEVFSKLDFMASTTFASEDDMDGQMLLRSTRYWGRLYIDGWPQTIQYFLAHFGDPPPIGKHKFVFSNPIDACEPLLDSEYLSSDYIILAKRGKCTFGTKALQVHSSSKVSGLIIINNEEGLEHLPGPDAYDIANFSIMSIPMIEGELLYNYTLSPFSFSENESRIPYSNYFEGYVVPINCDHHSPECLPATVLERKVITELKDGGLLHIHALPKNNTLKPKESIEYLLGQFGVKVPPSNKQFSLVLAKPSESCESITNNITGKAVVVRRGGCEFITKAQMIQKAGGIAMILSNSYPYLLRMGVEPRWKGMNISIPVVTVSKASYSILVGESYSDSTISFEESMEVSSSIWQPLEQLYNGESWPRSETFIHKKYEELKQQHNLWTDRLHTITEAYQLKLKSENFEKQETDAVKSSIKEDL